MTDDDEQEISSEEKSYFAMIPHMADDDLSVYEYRLYGHYRRVCGEKGKCTEKVRTTAEKLGISPSTVIAARQKLAERTPPYIRLHSRRVRNFERVDVTLTDIWPTNMIRFSNGTDRGANGTDRLVVPLKKNQYKEEPIKEKPIKENSFVRSELTGEAPGTNERTNESIAMLTDESILMSKKTVIAKLSATYQFETIRAFCCKFIADGKIPGKDAGQIAYWLEAGDTVPPTPHCDFYQRHRTPAEIAADAQAQAEIDQRNAEWDARQAARQQAEETARQQAAQPVPITAPTAHSALASAPVAAADIWQMVLNDLALSTPAPTYEQWLRGTTALSYSDGTFEIGVSDAYARDWLSNRLRPQIKRILSRLTQRSTEVTFAVRPRPHTNGNHS